MGRDQNLGFCSINSDSCRGGIRNVGGGGSGSGCRSCGRRRLRTVRGWVVERESELHPTNATRLGGTLAKSLDFLSTTTHLVGGLGTLVARSTKLLNIPEGIGKIPLKRLAAGEEGMDGDELSLLSVELVTHIPREFFELPLGLCIVGFDHDVVEVPEPPAEVFKTLTLFEVGSDLCAYFPCLGKRVAVVHVVKGDKRFVALKWGAKKTKHEEGVFKGERNSTQRALNLRIKGAILAYEKQTS